MPEPEPEPDPYLHHPGLRGRILEAEGGELRVEVGGRKLRK